MSRTLSQALCGALFIFAFSSVQAASAPADPAAAQREAASPVYHIKGVLKAIAPDAVTLAHEAVPELQWPAMTMPFALAKGLTLPPLAADEAVTADVTLVDGRYIITAISARR